MPRSPYVLAALVSAALPGTDPVRTVLVDRDADLDEAVVEDAGGERCVVRAPRTAAAGAALEREVAVLAALGRGPARLLPFAVPAVRGAAALPEGGRAVVTTHCPGWPLDAARLRPGPGAASLGRALAAVHELPADVVADAGLPVYTAAEHRERLLSELDRAAGTGRVPSRLLSRWEGELEDVGRWRFVPAVVHGDLVGEHVLAGPPRDPAVTALLGWGDAHVGDPADDLGWLAAAAPEAALDAVLEAYALARAEEPDRALADRARLAGELALARWLLHGVQADDADVVDDAARMLADLDAAEGGAS